MEIKLMSDAFKAGEPIPACYSCEAENISPPMYWSNVPNGAKSLVLICDDPDAPEGIFVHWVYYNIPPDTNRLPEDIMPIKYPEIGGEQGTNDFQRIGYKGPCPPEGSHRYFFKIYALDVMLKMDSGARKEQVEQAMKGHILATGELVGVYEKEQYRSAA